jgi:hypothetical protein
MKNSTNILLIVVIILLLATLVDKRLENNTLRADSGGAINGMIFATDPLVKERFYIVNADAKKSILYYEYDQSSKSILLKATRQTDYDFQLGGAYSAKGNQGDTYAIVKKEVEKDNNPTKK